MMIKCDYWQSFISNCKIKTRLIVLVTGLGLGDKEDRKGSNNNKENWDNLQGWPRSQNILFMLSSD